MSYQESDLIKVLRSVGQLALRTLLSDNPLLQKSEVLRIAGDFVLDYGFLAGHKDFTDPTADMYVTYAHRSIEEFFGSFGFLQALADGKSIHNILGSDCEKTDTHAESFGPTVLFVVPNNGVFQYPAKHLSETSAICC